MSDTNTAPSTPAPAADPLALPEISQTAAPAAVAPTPDPVQAVNTPAPDVQAAAQVAKELFSADELGGFTKEFDSSGTLSEDTIKKIVDRGLPKQLVDVYVQGITAQRELVKLTVFNEAGGADSYATIQKWVAQGGITPAEREAYNAALKTGRPAEAQKAAAELTAKYRKANGNPPTLRPGVPANVSSLAPFGSRQEMIAAMSDKRYDVDPAYRKLVADRIAVSKTL